VGQFIHSVRGNPTITIYEIRPDKDPVTLHERIWHTRLLCPGGGTYVWNDQLQTMESTIYGNPLQLKDGPAVPAVLQGIQRADFSVAFENGGLHAVMSVDRDPAIKE